MTKMFVMDDGARRADKNCWYTADQAIENAAEAARKLQRAVSVWEWDSERKGEWPQVPSARLHYCLVFPDGSTQKSAKGANPFKVHMDEHSDSGSEPGDSVEKALGLPTVTLGAVEKIDAILGALESRVTPEFQQRLNDLAEQLARTEEARAKRSARIVGSFEPGSVYRIGGTHVVISGVSEAMGTVELFRRDTRSRMMVDALTLAREIVMAAEGDAPAPEAPVPAPEAPAPEAEQPAPEEPESRLKPGSVALVDERDKVFVLDSADGLFIVLQENEIKQIPDDVTRIRAVSAAGDPEAKALQRNWESFFKSQLAFFDVESVDDLDSEQKSRMFDRARRGWPKFQRQQQEQQEQQKNLGLEKPLEEKEAPPESAEPPAEEAPVEPPVEPPAEPPVEEAPSVPSAPPQKSAPPPQEKSAPPPSAPVEKEEKPRAKKPMQQPEAASIRVEAMDPDEDYNRPEYYEDFNSDVQQTIHDDLTKLLSGVVGDLAISLSFPGQTQSKIVVVTVGNPASLQAVRDVLSKTKHIVESLKTVKAPDGSGAPAIQVTLTNAYLGEAAEKNGPEAFSSSWSNGPTMLSYCMDLLGNDVEASAKLAMSFMAASLRDATKLRAMKSMRKFEGHELRADWFDAAILLAETSKRSNVKASRDIDLTPPADVQKIAARALDKASKDGVVLPSITAQHAKLLVAGKPISLEAAERMHLFLTRHVLTAKNETLWDAWGGHAGKRWTAKLASMLNPAQVGPVKKEWKQAFARHLGTAVMSTLVESGISNSDFTVKVDDGAIMVTASNERIGALVGQSAEVLGWKTTAVGNALRLSGPGLNKLYYDCNKSYHAELGVPWTAQLERVWQHRLEAGK